MVIFLASVAPLDAHLTGNREVACSTPAQQHSFVEIDPEIFSFTPVC